MELISTSAYPKHKRVTNEENYKSFAKMRTCFWWVIGGGGDCCVCVVHKQGLLGLSLYFIVALTAQIFPFPAYKPAFRLGLFAFSAFVSKHNPLARETKKEKRRFPKTHKKIFVKKVFPASRDNLCKTFSRHLRFKNHLILIRTFEQTIEQPQEGAIFVYLYYYAVSRLNTRKPINQSDKSPLCCKTHVSSSFPGPLIMHVLPVSCLFNFPKGNLKQ